MSERNLTGIWNGLYTYADGRSTAFVATLLESGGSFTGTTHEPSTLGRSRGATLYANIVGSRQHGAVTFTKTYDPPERNHDKPIRYEGVLNADATEIEGRWTIHAFWSGKFLMIRPGNRAVTVKRAAFARS